MAEFHFNAADYEPWLGSPREGANEVPYESPVDFAHDMWKRFAHDDEMLSLDLACALAVYDRKVWDEVQRWAWSQDVDAMSDALAAALGRALGRRPPRGGKGTTKRRDARLCAVAAALGRFYGLPPTRGIDTGTAQSASAILSGLPGMEMVTEKRIINILGSGLPKNRG